MRLDVAAVPFAQAPFQGAASPRELAERMRQQPQAGGAAAGERRGRALVRGQRLGLPGCRASRPGASPPCSSSSSAWACPSRRRCSCPRGIPVCLYCRRKSSQARSRCGPTPRNGSTPRPTATGLAAPADAARQRAAAGAIAFEVDSDADGRRRLHEGTVQVTANAGQQIGGPRPRGLQPAARAVHAPAAAAVLRRALLACCAAAAGVAGRPVRACWRAADRRPRRAVARWLDASR